MDGFLGLSHGTGPPAGTGKRVRALGADHGAVMGANMGANMGTGPDRRPQSAVEAA
jgi:hypothetical protein